MIDRRLILVLPALALLAACGEGAVDEGDAATGEVLEGTISDAMLPVDRVRSEPPLEDPEAFAEVQEEADEAAADVAEASEVGEVGEEAELGEDESDGAEEAPAEEPAEAAAE